jgi:hypothetical protein
MKKKEKQNELKHNWNLLMGLIYFMFAIAVCLLGYLLLENHINEYLNRKVYTPEELTAISKRYNSNADANFDKIENGIHLRTGLHADPNLQTIIGSCLSCHSAKLITQNRATREGWKDMIQWMQKSQGLQELGSKEPIILDYLAKYYAPKKTGRRKNIDLAEVKWYILDLEKE